MKYSDVGWYMKICVISSLYKPYSRGGAVTVAENVVDGLHEVGHAVVLITLDRKEQREEIDGITIYTIKPFNIFSFLDIAKYHTFLRMIWHVIDVFNISSYTKVKKILEKEKPQLVMTHNLKGIGYLIPRLVKKLRIKHIHTLHDIQLIRPSAILIYGKQKPFLIFDLLYEKVCRYLFDSPDIVLSPSSWLMDFYVVRGFFYHSKKEVIQNPVGRYELQKSEDSRRMNPPTFPRGIERREKDLKSPFIPAVPRPRDRVFREGEGIKDDTVHFLYLGQLESFKGILFLIDSLKELANKNWRLRIVGDGGSKQDVQERISRDDRFMFYGFVKRAKLSNIFGQTDCAIIPSLCYENSPTVIYESFAAGVPVIASDIGGIPELVKDNVNGFTFEPGDKENLKKVLQFYLEHPQLEEKLKQNTRPTIQGFTTDKYLKRVFSLV